MRAVKRGGKGGPETAMVEQLQVLDIRVGRITAVKALREAQKPLYRLTIDFGRLGLRWSAAALRPTTPGRSW